MPVKQNPLKAGLARGTVQVGTWVNMIRTPAVLTLLRSAGLDYARIDMEHSPPSMETIADMAALARALDFPILVRPPSGDREWVTRLLDAGVWGLHIPQVDTPEIARAVVAAALYEPAGQRGMAGIGPHNDFTPGASLAELNEQVHITVMLESPRAFENLDEIIATPGVDAVTLGPSDLAQELGVLGKPEQGSVIDGYRQRMIESALRHGKDVAMLCDTPRQAARWVAAGVKIIVLSSEVAVLHDAYRAMSAELRAAIAQPNLSLSSSASRFLPMCSRTRDAASSLSPVAMAVRMLWCSV
jgi:2-keto-3-deoxy-L-rhamnonate aldolase RhmA